MPLFRHEVVRRRAETLFGEILLPRPRWLGWFVLGVTTLVAIILVALASGQYEKRIKAVGWLSYNPGVASISARHSGTIISLPVKNGSRVEPGDTLLVISTARSTTKSADVEGLLIDSLQLQRDALREQVRVETLLNDEELVKLDRKLDSVKAEIESLDRSLALQESRLQLTRQEEIRSLSLEQRGFVATKSREQSQLALLEMRLAIEEMRQRREEKRNLLSDLQQERTNLPVRTKQRLAELEVRMSVLSQQLAEIENARDSAIIATISGYVSGLTAHVGQSISPGARVMTIVPDNARLKAKLLVPSRAAGRLQEGMTVNLSYDAFPFQEYGQYQGTVGAIDRVVLPPLEQTGLMSLNEPAFQVVVDLEQEFVSANGVDFPLRGGLTLQAFIIQERRKIIQWILDPLYSAASVL